MPSSEIPSAGGELKQLDGKDNCFASVLARPPGHERDSTQTLAQHKPPAHDAKVPDIAAWTHEIKIELQYPAYPAKP